MATYDLTNQPISSSFDSLLQIDSGSVVRDGTGSVVDILNTTASFATTASYALIADRALNASASSDWNDITDKPSGLVSGSSQIDLAQTFGTASHAISASYAVSASVEIIKEISSSYADHTEWTGIYNIPSGLVSGSSQVVLEDTTFTDNGEFSFLQTDGLGNLSFQYVESINDVVYAGENITKTDPLYVSGSQGANPTVYKADAADPNKAAIYIAAENITQGSTGRGILLGGIDAVDLTGIPAGTVVYLGEGGGWSTSRPSGSNSIVQPLGIVTKTGSGGKGEILNPGPATLPNLQSGYAWVGDGGNQPQAVATSSFAVSIDTGSLVTTSSFNAYTSSNDSKVQSLIDTTGSLLLTASFDNNTRDLTFTKVDNTTFALNIPGQSGSVEWDDVLNKPSGLVSGSSQLTGSFVTTNTLQTITAEKRFDEDIHIRSDNKIRFGNFDSEHYINSTGANVNVIGDAINSKINLITGIPIVTTAFIPEINIKSRNKITGKINLETINFNISASNTIITGSVDIKETFTSSLQEGYILVGNSSNRTSAIPTSSLVVDIDTGSLITTSSFNNYTSSTDARLSSIELETASLDGRVTSLENFSSSLDATYVTETELGVATQSLQNSIATKLDTGSYLTDSASFDGRIDSLENFSSSLDTNFVSETEFGIYTSSNDSKVNSLISATGSYATTGSNNFLGNQDISGSISSTLNISNTHLNPLIITDNVNIPTGQNGVIIGNTTIAGTYTVEGDSEVYVFTEPDLDGYLTKGEFNPISASLDSRINASATTGSNTFSGNQILSGSFTITTGSFEVGTPDDYPNGKVNLGVYGNIVLRSGSGIITDGAFGPSIPFDSKVDFFQGTGHQDKPAEGIKFVGMVEQTSLPDTSGNNALAVSGSNLYFYDGTQWKQVSLI